MFRLESRIILLICFAVTWSIPVYMVFKYSEENDALTKSGANLRKEIENLQTKLSSYAATTDRFRAKDFKRDAKISDGVSRTMLEQANTNDAPVGNIFVELEPTRTHPNQPALAKQFYKTFGSKDDQQQRELFGFVKRLPEHKRKRILVTGGAGFVGSHLVDRLMLDGHEVIVCDNFFTGRKSNIDHWQGHSNFELINHDVINPLTIEVNEIYHLASPASPVHYMSNPIKTIKTNSVGTINMLGLAKRVGARILIASTSEIYGDPQVHPQAESYWGNANPIGPRSCYDESKRLSESLAVAYHSRENVSIGIARIFNTYGPRMHPNDGRVVSNFVMQAINNEPMTVYGSGKQTRSFQYVTDLVLGLKKLMESELSEPVNLGNPDEMTIISLAMQVKRILKNSTSNVVFSQLPVDDPHRRRPDIRRARSLLEWEPVVPLVVGLERTVDYFIQEIKMR